MASPANTLPSGVQELYDTGMFPDQLSQDTLSQASAPQLNQLASATVAQRQIGILLGNFDSVSLSPEAVNALFGADQPADNLDYGSPAADYFTQAVNNQLTNNINSAVDTFLPISTNPPVHNINVLA